LAIHSAIGQTSYIANSITAIASVYYLDTYTIPRAEVIVWKRSDSCESYESYDSHNNTEYFDGKFILMARSEEGKPTLHVRNFPLSLLQRINGIASLAGADRDALVVHWLEEATKKHAVLQTELTEAYKSIPRAKAKGLK
jgi:hypothetical protein